MRQKQLTGMYGYLGSFDTLDDLQARYPAPRLNSYAFVAEKIYKYTTSGWAVAYETGGEAASNFRDYVMLTSGSNPLSGNLRMFAKTIKRMFTRDSLGVEAMVCDDSGWQPEYPGLACDGVDDYISIADNANLNFPATPFMQEFFVKMPTDVTTSQYLSNKGTNSISVYITGGLFALRKRGVASWGAVSVSQYAGKLLHVIAGWDGANRLMYFNGQLVQSASQLTDLIESTIYAQVIGSDGSGAGFFKGSIYLARFWNLALSASEVLQLYNNGQPQNSVILSKYRGASQVNKVVNGTFDTDTGWTKGAAWTIAGGVATYNASLNGSGLLPTAGFLVAGKIYKLKFTLSTNARIGILSSAGAVITSPANYAAGSVEIVFRAVDSNFRISGYADNGGGAFSIDNVETYQLGTVLELKGENMGHVSAIDTSGNRLHGAMNGTPALTVNPLQQKATTGNFTTNIASGTANKDIIIPAGYYVTAITVANTLASGNLTNVQAVLDPTGDNITLITGKTVNNAKVLTFTALADQTQFTSSMVVRVNATGNGTGGMEVMLILARRD